MRTDPAPDCTITRTGAAGADTGGIAVEGALTVDTLARAQPRFEALAKGGADRLDLSGVTRFDTAGAWLVVGMEQRSGGLVIDGASAEAESLIAAVRTAWPTPPDERPEAARPLEALAGVGRAVLAGGRFVASHVGYLGLFLSRLGRALRHPREFRLTALVHHCEEVGVKAVGIVALMAFLIGIVLAFQGASQLRQFGAEVFVVDLIAVSILRELGILLTSIIVAGRTASAFTAAIGSMKMREEIDAMQTLGLDPAMLLFVPRILALLVTLPILGMIANLAGLFGGALMAWIELGISPELFRTRLLDGIGLNHLFVGLIKAPVFALIIGIVGCHAGMQVKSNAESLGRQTSKAVVTAIFTVIVADAAFSIFFAEVGL